MLNGTFATELGRHKYLASPPGGLVGWFALLVKGTQQAETGPVT